MLRTKAGLAREAYLWERLSGCSGPQMEVPSPQLGRAELSLQIVCLSNTHRISNVLLYHARDKNFENSIRQKVNRRRP